MDPLPSTSSEEGETEEEVSCGSAGEDGGKVLVDKRPGNMERVATQLPSPDQLFQKTVEAPSFLDPEAIRDLPAYASNSERPQPVDTSNKEKEEWDISKMAPKLKTEFRDQEKGVISGKATTYRGGAQESGLDMSVQIALLGGGEGKPQPKKATKATNIDEFLTKGVGGQQLPRKRQDTKEREKSKRSRGQSSHSTWKSEAEMALRQQYD